MTVKTKTLSDVIGECQEAFNYSADDISYNLLHIPRIQRCMNAYNADDTEIVKACRAIRDQIRLIYSFTYSCNKGSINYCAEMTDFNLRYDLEGRLIVIEEDEQ